MPFIARNCPNTDYAKKSVVHLFSSPLVKHHSMLYLDHQGLDGRWAMEPNFISGFTEGVPPPAVVLPDGYGKARLVPLSDQGGPDAALLCPPTHAQCHNQGYCIPEFMLCNGVKDCPDGEDELIETCQMFCQDRCVCL